MIMASLLDVSILCSKVHQRFATHILLIDELLSMLKEKFQGLKMSLFSSNMERVALACVNL